MTEKDLQLIKVVGIAQILLNEVEELQEISPRAKTMIQQPARNLVVKYEKFLNQIYQKTNIDAHDIIGRFVKEFDDNFKIVVED